MLRRLVVASLLARRYSVNKNPPIKVDFVLWRLVSQILFLGDNPSNDTSDVSSPFDRAALKP